MKHSKGLSQSILAHNSQRNSAGKEKNVAARSYNLFDKY